MLHVDGLEPGGGLPVGAERVVVLGPDPADPLRHLHDLPAQGLRLAPDGRHGAFQAQHPLDVLPELERALDLTAEVAHPGLDPVHLRARVGKAFGLLLRRRQPRAQRLEILDLSLDRHAALAQRVQLGGPFHHRRQLTELLRGGFSAGNEGFERGCDIRSTLVDGDHGFVVAAAAFQERDHGSLQDRARKRRIGSDCARGGEDLDTRRTTARSATGVPARAAQVNEGAGALVPVRNRLRARRMGRWSRAVCAGSRAAPPAGASRPAGVVAVWRTERTRGRRGRRRRKGRRGPLTSLLRPLRPSPSFSVLQ